LKHFVLIRSVYGPRPLDLNRRRIELAAGITVRSLVAQTDQQFEVVVCMDINDPLKVERQAMFGAHNLTTWFVYIDSANLTPDQTGIAAYRAPWHTILGDGPYLTTRIDDDDAFAPDAIARIKTLYGRAIDIGRDIGHTKEFAIVLPNGYRVWGGRYSPIEHRSNAWSTLYTPTGPHHVYTYRHREIAKHVPVVYGNTKPGWLWVRHPDTLSGHKAALKPYDDELRTRFPIDWALLDLQPLVEPRKGERKFR